MEPSKVYFASLRVHDGDNLQKKLERLIRRAASKPSTLTGNSPPSKFTSASREIWHTCAPITRRP